MKKLFSLFSAICLCFLLSCNSSDSGSKTNEQAQKNLDAMHAVNKMFETGDYSKIADYIDSNAVDHAGMKGDVVGLDSIKAEFAMFGTMMGNMKSETVKEMADSNYVMAWMKQSGTMKMDGMGMKAGQNFNLEAIEVAKFKDGKSTDHWTFINYTDMMKMMPPPPPMKEDKKAVIKKTN